MERYRTTIILGGLLLVLIVAFALLNNNRGDTTTGDGVTPSPTTYVWQSDNPVVAIDIVSGTGKVSLRKDITTTEWSLIEPVRDAADIFAVNNIADSIRSLQATSTLTDSSKLAEYGLATPGMSVTVTYSDTAATRRTMNVGGPNFNGSAYYVKTADSPTIYLVSNGLIEPLRSWLTTPPVAPPTPTAGPTIVIAPTIAPTIEGVITGTVGIGITSTVAVTGTTVVTGTILPDASPQPVAGTPTQPLTGTGTITGTLPITNTLPGAANPTTPLSTPVLQPTGTP